MKTIKRFFYDVSTTGKSFYKSSIHHLNAMVVINGVVVDRLDLRIKPDERALLELDYMRFNGVIPELLKTLPDQTVQFRQLETFLNKYVDRFNKSDKFYLCGFHNSNFDDAFLSMFFSLNKNDYFGAYFYSASLDVATLAAQYLLSERDTMTGFKLVDVAKQLGLYVDENRVHLSDYANELCYKIYQIITGERLRF